MSQIVRVQPATFGQYVMILAKGLDIRQAMKETEARQH